MIFGAAFKARVTTEGIFSVVAGLTAELTFSFVAGASTDSGVAPFGSEAAFFSPEGIIEGVEGATAVPFASFFGKTGRSDASSTFLF